MNRSRGFLASLWLKIEKNFSISFILLLFAVLLGNASLSLAKTWKFKGNAARTMQDSSSPQPQQAIAASSPQPVLEPPTPEPEQVPLPEETPPPEPAPPVSPPVRVAATPQVIEQGNSIELNGKMLPVAWMRWQDGNSERFGISDTGASELGIELASATSPDAQPARWFSAAEAPPILLKTLFRNPYRYLDLTALAAQIGAKWETAGDTLILRSQPAKIVNIREGQQDWGQRIVIDLDRPTFWQATQGREEASVTLDGTADAALLQRFSSRLSPETASPPQNLQSFLQSKIQNPKSKILKVEPAGAQTTLRFKLSDAKGLKVSTLPNRLVIDITSDPFVDRAILWQPGVLWKQQQVSVGNARFPVTSLELDPRAGIGLRPIWSNIEGMTGIEPLVKTGRTWQAVAAINGGFFNRNTKQPLGAIRRDGRWFSGPILNRGAIAWDDRGNVKIGRLYLQETLTTSTGQRLPIVYLNSGYAQAGISRYTPEWGQSYIPLTDDEMIVLVQNDSVTYQYPGGEHGKTTFPIPPDGYILTIRANSTSPQTLAVGTQVSIASQTVPEDFANYPQIIGAGPLLVQNRQIVLNAADEKFSAAFNQEAAPRSIIATSDRGTLLIAAVHNPPGSRGPTLAQLAQLVQKLGVVDALNLDGGSSTSLYLGGHLIDRDPITAARVHNGIGIYLPASP